MTAPTLTRTKTGLGDVLDAVFAADADADVRVTNARTVHVTTTGPAHAITDLIRAEWTATVQGPVDEDGFVDPADARVTATTRTAHLSLTVIGKPHPDWQRDLGPGDIVEYTPTDGTSLRNVDRDRLYHRMRVLSMDPLHGQTVTVSDEHEGYETPDGWAPGQWDTDARNLTVWASAEHAEDVHLSAWLCPCGAQVPAQNLAEDVLCDTCEANTQEEL